jgi:UDP-N-acetylglucosamine--dolichyl-phosphate N-acetylglucosaminephosphotransferase
LLLGFIAAIPLIALNAGESSFAVPFFGTIDIGILYPLLVIPFVIAGCSTVYNFLAGFNGLEASQGIIILSALSFVAYSTGSLYLALTGMVMIASLIAFYLFNKNPASVFPGDSITLSIGALIAGMAIVGNFEKIAVFIFIPYLLEMGLKLRGGLNKHSFGKPNPDGSLEMPYKKIYGLEHLAIYLLKKFKKSEKAYENEVVYFINAFQIIIILIGFWLFL